MSLSSRRDANVLVQELLSRLLDERLDRLGFTRRRTSRKYLRDVPGGYQSIDFNVFFRPPYARPLSHVSVDAILHFRELMDLANEMLGDASIVRQRADIALRRPIDALRPGNPPLWLFDDERSLATFGGRIVEDVESYVLPFLSKSASLTQFISLQSEAYRGIADTLAVDPVLLAAAIILDGGSRDQALEVLERHYPSGSRGSELYGAAFEYVTTKIA